MSKSKKVGKQKKNKGNSVKNLNRIKEVENIIKKFK